jgi:hypothetical protein
MEVFQVQCDGKEHLVASGLSPAEAYDLWEWWCYTKPLGPDVKVVVRAGGQSRLSMNTTGTEPSPAHPAVTHMPSEVFIG